MKKKLLSLSLCLCLALSLAIPAYAADAEPVVSDEQYQNYLEIAEQVCEERGIDITVCPASEMETVYTDAEFEAEVQDFCDVLEAIKENTITPYSNPSSGGAGDKSLSVNASKNNSDGYFLWTVNGTANVISDTPYRLGNVRISSIISVRTPGANFGSMTLGSPVQSGSGNTKYSKQSVRIIKDGVGTSTVQITATFQLTPSTGSVTMRASAS